MSFHGRMHDNRKRARDVLFYLNPDQLILLEVNLGTGH